MVLLCLHVVGFNGGRCCWWSYCGNIVCLPNFFILFLSPFLSVSFRGIFAVDTQKATVRGFLCIVAEIIIIFITIIIIIMPMIFLGHTLKSDKCLSIGSLFLSANSSHNSINVILAMMSCCWCHGVSNNSDIMLIINIDNASKLNKWLLTAAFVSDKSWQLLYTSSNAMTDIVVVRTGIMPTAYRSHMPISYKQLLVSFMASLVVSASFM